MKLLPSIKSAKSLALVAATIATAIASNVAPSQASRPTRIIQTAGQPEIVIFEGEGQSVAAGCQAVRNLWKGLNTQQVSPQEYQSIIGSARGFLKGHLYCNNPNQVKGYTSPAFPNAGVIVTDGKPFYVTTRAFFPALGITPTQLSQADGAAFTRQNLQLNTNVTLEPNLATRTSSISIANKGLYVARYSTAYNVLGRPQSQAFDVPLHQKAVFNLPSQATNIVVVAEYYTGLFNQKKEFFRKSMSSLDANICYTTTGTTLNQQVNNSCN